MLPKCFMVSYIHQNSDSLILTVGRLWGDWRDRVEGRLGETGEAEAGLKRGWLMNRGSE